MTRWRAVPALCGALLVALVAGCAMGTTTMPDAAGSGLPTVSASGSPTGGTSFADPGGSYTVTVGPGWHAVTAPAEGVEAWSVAPEKEGFAPNVSILTQNVPDLTVAEFVTLSLKDMDKVQAISRSTVVVPGGRQLGRVEYTQTTTVGGKARSLHLLALCDVVHGRAVVATLTAEEDSFARLRAAVEPYLETLRTT